MGTDVFQSTFEEETNTRFKGTFSHVFFLFFFTLFKGSNGFHIEGKYHPLDEYLEHALKLVNMHNVKTKTQNFCFFVLKKHV